MTPVKGSFNPNGVAAHNLRPPPERVKMLTTKCDDLSLSTDPHGGRGGLTPGRCPLTSSEHTVHKNVFIFRTGEMAPWLKLHTALAEDPSWVPSSHVWQVTYICNFWGSNTSRIYGHLHSHVRCYPQVHTYKHDFLQVVKVWLSGKFAVPWRAEIEQVGVKVLQCSAFVALATKIK